MRSFIPFFLIPVVWLSLQGHCTAADETVGIVTKIRGQVTARKTGDESVSTLRVGDRIVVGQMLRSTGGAAAQLVLTDDSVVYLLPGTTIQVNQYGYSAEDQRRSAIIKVTAGTARFIVYKMRSDESRFIVVTDQARVSVEIADFFVSIFGAATEIANIGPTLSTKNISPFTVGWVRVGTNQRCVIAEKTPPSQPSTITPQQRRKYLKDTEI